MLRKFTLRHKAPLAIVSLGAFAAALPHCAFSQDTLRRSGPALKGEWAIEQQESERWMHGRQQSRFTPRHSSDEWIFVDSIRPIVAGQRIWLAIARNARPESAVIDVGPSGHVATLRFHRAAPSTDVRLPSDSSFEDFLRRAPGGDVALHETRAWDLLATAPPGVPRVGLSWRDTIARVATDGAYRQALHGTRVSRIVGRRTVNGHELWVVRDSAAVRHDEEYPERERTLAGATVSRTALGTIVGVHLWDPGLPLVRELEDTTVLAGVAILRYPDGRVFRTPARFERTRRRTLFDAAGYAARSAERSAAVARMVGGMVILPTDSLERRLASGDTKARDSLIGAWRRETDPDSAARIFRLLVQWGARDTAFRARLDSLRVAAGDTAFLYQRLADRAYGGHPFDRADVRAMLPFMRDPRLPWSFGLSRDILYENLAQALTLWPPIVASRIGDSACTPAACRLLGTEWPSAAEPRLRDVGLVARFVTDPRRWTDTVLARDGPDHPLLHGVARLARGAAATWDAASHAAIPTAGSDWRAWLQWMDGRDSTWLAWLRQSSLPARIKQDTLPKIRFESSHVTAIRFTEARTGRDIVAELRRGYAAASSDSARLVFGSMLQGLGALHLGEVEIAEAFRSGDSTRIPLARSALIAGFARSAKPADTAVAIALLDRLLGAIADSTALWPNVGDAQANRRDPAILHMPRGIFFVDTLGIPARIRTEWGSRVTFLPKPAWNARDVRAPGVFYSIAPLTTWGRFARVQVTSSERFARKPDEAPRGYASGMTYWLMNVDGQWVVVAQMGWVT